MKMKRRILLKALSPVFGFSIGFRIDQNPFKNAARGRKAATRTKCFCGRASANGNYFSINIFCSVCGFLCRTIQSGRVEFSDFSFSCQSRCQLRASNILGDDFTFIVYFVRRTKVFVLDIFLYFKMPTE